MKEIIKPALLALSMYGLMVLVAFMFTGTLLADNMFFRWLSFALVFALLNGVGFFEGGTRGEADSAFERRILKREADRGEPPTQEERRRFFKRWKGVAFGLLGLSPVILFALYMFICGLSGLLPEGNWQTPVMRILLWPYITLFPADISRTWYYLPLSLIFPASIAVGYLMGPKRFAKLLRTISENNRRRKAKRKPRKVVR